MPINYEWECKFCEKPNAAGTDRCAFCRNPAIARPIDVDPRYEKERLEDQKRRERLERLPPALRGVVATLWTIFVVGAVIARFGWTFAAMAIGGGLMVITGIPAILIEKFGKSDSGKAGP